MSSVGVGGWKAEKINLEARKSYKIDFITCTRVEAGWTGVKTIDSERENILSIRKIHLWIISSIFFGIFFHPSSCFSLISVFGTESSSSPIKSVMTTMRERYRTHVKHLREPGSTLGSRQRWCGGRGNEALKDTLRDLQGATLWWGEREGSRIFLDKYPVFSCSSIFSLFHIEKEKKGEMMNHYSISYIWCAWVEGIISVIVRKFDLSLVRGEKKRKE